MDGASAMWPSNRNLRWVSVGQNRGKGYGCVGMGALCLILVHCMCRLSANYHHGDLQCAKKVPKSVTFGAISGPELLKNEWVDRQGFFAESCVSA